MYFIFAVKQFLVIFLYSLYIISDIPLRLYGGNKPSEGAVELLSNGAWARVCSQNFTQKEATVACRSLGYTYT